MCYAANLINKVMSILQVLDDFQIFTVTEELSLSTFLLLPWNKLPRITKAGGLKIWMALDKLWTTSWKGVLLTCLFPGHIYF